MRGSIEHEPGKGSDGEEPHDRFSRIVASLTEGALTFKPPFDLASAAALALNLDSGDVAQALFDVTAGRETRYVVSITARVADTPEVGDREIINTEVNGPQLLIALLDALCDELENTPSHPTGE